MNKSFHFYESHTSKRHRMLLFIFHFCPLFERCVRISDFFISSFCLLLCNNQAVFCLIFFLYFLFIFIFVFSFFLNKKVKKRIEEHHGINLFAKEFFSLSFMCVFFRLSYLMIVLCKCIINLTTFIRLNSKFHLFA